jgi:hypothetical protein
MTIDSGASARIEGCDISYNKCGGVHFGYNYDGLVELIDCDICWNLGLSYRSLAEEDPDSGMDFSFLSHEERLMAGLPPGATRKWTRRPLVEGGRFDHNPLIHKILRHFGPLRVSCLLHLWCRECAGRTAAEFSF